MVEDPDALPTVGDIWGAVAPLTHAPVRLDLPAGKESFRGDNKHRFQCMQVTRLLAQLLLLLSLGTTTARAETIRISLGEWPPYIGSRLDGYGKHATLVARAFAGEGIRVEFVPYPWKRAIRTARHGRTDGTMLWMATPDREADFYISEPVSQYRWVFFHLEGTVFDWENLSDLESFTIGAVRGFRYSPGFHEAALAGQIKVSYVTRNSQLVNMLAGGRVDLIPMEFESGYHLLRATLSPQEAERVTHHPRPLTVNPLHLLLSRKIPENSRRIEQFNRGLARIREAGSAARSGPD